MLNAITYSPLFDRVHVCAIIQGHFKVSKKSRDICLGNPNPEEKTYFTYAYWGCINYDAGSETSGVGFRDTQITFRNLTKKRAWVANFAWET